MKLKTLQTLWKFWLFKILWNYLDINYVFQSTYNLWALYGFNPMPYVVSQWSPDLISAVFVTMESNLGQYPFTLDDTFFPATYGGKRFIDCVWVRLLPMGPKDHMQKRSYLTRSPCCPWRERQNFEGMCKATTHGAKRLHIWEDNIMSIVNGWIPWPIYVIVWYICDKLPYVRFYSFGIILLVLTD